ncbi:MAG: DNA polymerase III subunit delta [Bacteroidota bacterium]
MNFQEIQKQLKNKSYQPIYFLHGSEAYFIDQITHYIEQNALNEAEKAFNQSIFYGKEINHLQVVDAARRFPMMSQYQVVIIKEAQEMKSLKELLTYVEKPQKQTILVIAHKYKKFNFNSKFGKALKKNAVVFESKALYDNQVPDWIQSYLAGKKLKITPDACVLMAEYLGTDLSKISNELDKLSINIEAGTEINQQHIEDNIGISKDYNVFELQKALGTKQVLKANRIVQYFASNPKKNPTPVVLASLYNYFSKLYMLRSLPNTPDKELVSTLGLRSAYFLKEYKASLRYYSKAELEKVIDLLSEYDLKSKGVNFVQTGKAEGELLKELVWRILHKEQSLNIQA